MKILIIDPRCVNASSSYYYVTGLASGLAKYSDVTLISVKDCQISGNSGYRLKNLFYPLSQQMPQNKFRQILRGIEYIFAYLYIIIHCILNKYDVIQVEWPIVYKVDKTVFRILKKKTRLFVLKAHNVLPHATGEKLTETFRKLYSIADKVIVHGEGMKREFIEYFPEYESKVYIQRHGIYTGHDLSFDSELIDPDIKERISRHKRLYLFYGRIDEDKGVDRLVNIWSRDLDGKSGLLAIAGKINPNYSSFSIVEDQIGKCKDILYLPGYVDDNLLNYLISNSALIIMPYVKGSMSGVAFTASEFSVPILTTKFGSIEEYVQDGQTGYVVDNDDVQLALKLNEIEDSVTDDELKKSGINMHNYYNENYQWGKIAEKLINECYAISS